MRRVVIVGCLVAAGLGCKKDGPGEAKAQPLSQQNTATGGGPKATATLLPGATCTFPERVAHDTTIAKDCVVDVVANVLIENGATLTVEPGATLRFHAATYLEVGHKGSKLVAKGTKEKPIVFTSGEEKKRPGDWVGIVFDDATGVGSTIEHAVVEYAGRDSHGGQGAVTVFSAFPAGRVTINDTTFRHNNLVAVSNRHPRATFASFDRNVFVDNARALAMSPGVLAAIGAGNEIGDEVEVTGGTISTAGTWPKIKKPIHVGAPVYVNGEGTEPAKLTIAPGNILRFAPKTWLEVGTTGPAHFHATNVTFTSAASKPAAGDWVGLFFGDKSLRSLVSQSTIEYAGAEEHGSNAAVTFVGSKTWQALDVSFLGVTFHHLKQASFSDNGEGCNKALDPQNGMSWAGVEPCR